MARNQLKKSRRGEEEEDEVEEEEEYEEEGAEEGAEEGEEDDDVEEDEGEGDEGAVGEISGPDSEEILSELYEKFADRDLVLFHRAIAGGNETEVKNALKEHPEWLEATLINVEAFPEVKKCNYIDFGSFSRFSNVRLQSTPYPEVEQFKTGDEGAPNELFPTGQVDQPEPNLDTAFWTPLLRACYGNHTNLLKLLVAAGANKDYTSPCKNNVVDCLLNNCCIDDAESLERNLALVATKESINAKDYITQVLTDEELSHKRIVQALLDHGHVLRVDSELMQGEMESWLDAEIVTLLKATAAQLLSA